MKTKEISESGLIKKINALGSITEEQKKSIACSLIGHSNVQTTFFGYHYCGRCGDQVGDSLASIYINHKQVVRGHNCPECRENAKLLTWKDTFLIEGNPLEAPADE